MTISNPEPNETEAAAEAAGATAADDGATRELGDPSPTEAPPTEAQPAGAQTGTAPNATAPTAAPTGAAQPAGTEPHTGKPRPRTGPIIWGALVLAFCLYVAQRSIAPGAVDTTTWLIAGVIGLGALLLVVGIAVLVRGAGRR